VLVNLRRRIPGEVRIPLGAGRRRTTRLDAVGRHAAAARRHPRNAARRVYRTVERWNEAVAAGADQDFQRGDSAYDRWSGEAAARA
jgi:hypothetical protein